MTAHTPTKTVDVRAFKHTREVVAYRDGGEFPVLVATPDGTLVAVLRGAAGHLGLAGRIDIVRSLDGGLNWTFPNIVADSERDDRNPGLGVTTKGTLVLSYACASSYDAEGKYFACKRDEVETYWDMRITRSTDNGLTWDEPYELTYQPLRSCSPFGKMVALPDGTTLMPCYGRPANEVPGVAQAKMIDEDSCAYLLHSHDDGKTWPTASLICANAGEPAVMRLSNGNLFAAVRREKMGKTVWGLYSKDGGFTWSEPVQIGGDMKHPGDLIELSNGDILLCYGNRITPPARIEGFVSRDGGKTWLDCLLTMSGHLRGYNADFPRHVDLGYPSSVLVPGSKPTTGVTMYYYNPSIDKHPDGLRRNESAYSNVNYVAIAVVWREDELLAAVNKAVAQ